MKLAPRRLAVPAITLLLTAAPAAGAATAHGHAKKHRTPPPEVRLTPALTATPGASVTMPPAGLSFEYPVMAADLGAGACPPPALTAELQRLGSPPLQLAGQSQDFTVPAQSAGSLTPNWEGLTLYTLAPEFWPRLHCLLSASPDPLTVGLNARSGQLAWAEQLASGAREAATGGLSFSLGNEPDQYYLPNFSQLAKPQPAEEASAVGLYLRAAAYLAPAAGGAPLTGPELASPARWQASLPRILSALHLQTLGIHAYPLSVCRTPRAATLSGLLEQSTGQAPARLAWVAAAAAAAGAVPVITEANSVSCGGKPGVSDSPASAVWAVRFVLSALSSGFREVRFHFSGNSYDPFYLRGGEVVRRPLEEAMTALNHWLPTGATLRSVAVHGLSATAIASAPGSSVLVLDNETAKQATVLLSGYAGKGLQPFSGRGTPPHLVPAPGGGLRATIPPGDVLAVSF